MGKSSMLRCLAIALSILFVSPVITADTNDLFFESTYDSRIQDQGRRTVELNENGSLAYASFGNTLVQYSPSNQGTIQSKIFDQEILSMALSPDGTRLALTIRDGGTAVDTIHILDAYTFNTKISSQATASNAVLLSWTDNGASLITNHPTSGLIKLNREDLSTEVQYTGNVSGGILCADISPSGTYTMGVDETGRLTIWDSIGDYIHHEFLLDSSVNDCSFDPTESMFTVSIDGDKIRKWTLSGSELRPLDTPGIKSYKWSSNGLYVYVHRTISGEFLSTYDSSDSSKISEVSLFHQFSEFELLESNPGVVEFAIFTSTTDHVVTYRSSHLKNGVGASGSDFDSDGIPNSIDDDDDGDGIEDIWDLNCNAAESFSCDLLPDENYMRSMNLILNETVLEVEETFTLNKSDSSIIRGLSRYSLDSDVKLSTEEAMLFANSYCENIHEENYSISIRNAIEIEGVSLNYFSMSCSVVSGMELTQVDDDRTHIRYSIITKFNMSGEIVIGDNAVRILYQPTAVQGSITILSEQHPISVSVTGQIYDADSFSPWFLQEESINLSLKAKIDDGEDNLVDSSIFTSWWFIALSISSVLVIGFLLYTLRNKEDSYSINLDDEEELDEEMLEMDESIEDSSFSDLEDIETSIIPLENVSTKTSPRTRSSSIRKESQQNPVTTTRKRRTRATKEDSTVKVSKRRRLVDDEVKPKVRKRRAVRQSIDVEDVEMSDALNRYEEN
ncbi:hypothetical protein N9X28_00660 [Candidatus Poseidoniales archaeon]|nr:hypothetical protein [Candidatus Poseidoniales archaeon]